MLGKHFYNESIRKTIVGFGTLFNNIELVRKDSDGDVVQAQRVPLTYGPREKLLARIYAQPDLLENQKTQITLPRISFEMTGISYDATRKLNPITTYKKTDNGNLKSQYLPVPYNLDFELSVISKNQDDAVQIVEQILPFFQPSLTISVNIIPDMNEVKDIPVVLQSVNVDDQYEGNYEQRRALIYNFTFVAKTYMYGPIHAQNTGVIRKVISDVYTTTNIETGTRELRYTVEPEALQDENMDSQFISAVNINTDSNTITLNSHGFVTGDKVTYRVGENSIAINPLQHLGTYYIIRIDANSFRLASTKRNATSSIALDLVVPAGAGTQHKFSVINEADVLLIDDDDNFGFNGEWS